MSKPKRPNFKPEFRLEVAQLVLDKGYSIREAAEAMDVGKSTVDKWARQLKDNKDIHLKIFLIYCKSDPFNNANS